MKTRYFAYAVAILAACFSSCSKENVAKDNLPSSCPKVIHVSVGDNPQTRVAMGEDLKPYWEAPTVTGVPAFASSENLNIYSYDAEGNPVFAFYYCTEPSTGEFTLNEMYGGWMNYSGESATPVGPYVVIYCGNMNPTVNMEDMTIVFFQPYNSASSESAGDLSRACMVAKCDDLDNVSLKNIMALLKVTVPENKYTYMAMEVYGVEDSTYDVENNTWSPRTIGGSRTLSIGNMWYDPEQGKTAADVQTLEAGDHYFPILPQTLTSDDTNPCFTLYYTANREEYTRTINYSSMLSKVKNGSVTLEAGKIYDLGTLE